MNPSGEDITGQMLLDLAAGTSLARDDLVAGRPNMAAIALVDAWPGWASPCAVLVGPPGSGKTHLAAIWAGEAKAHAADPSALSAHDLEAAQSGQPIVIDGLERRTLDETALFHLINAVRNAGTTMLVTAAQSPLTWNLKTPDLASRFKAMTIVEIGEPDDALLAAVITKLFADRQIAVDPSVTSYLVTRIERSLATAIDVVDRLDKASLARKAKITRQLAASVLRDIDEGQGRFEL